MWLGWAPPWQPTQMRGPPAILTERPRVPGRFILSSATRVCPSPRQPFIAQEALRLDRRRIDTKISTPQFDLPLGAIAGHDPSTALPQRTCSGTSRWQLPSGQRIAAAIGLRPLAAWQLSELTPLGVGFERSTPLWYYVLKEAEFLADGLQFGPLGGRIVAEVSPRHARHGPALVPLRAAELAADAAAHGQLVPHDRLPHVRRGRP